MLISGPKSFCVGYQW